MQPKVDPLELQKDAAVLGTYETDAFILSLRRRDEFAATHRFGYHRIPHIGVLGYCSSSPADAVYSGGADMIISLLACEHINDEEYIGVQPRRVSHYYTPIRSCVSAG